MSHSTTRPYGKWYESGRHFLFGFSRFTAEEMDLLRAEIEQDERERVCAAEKLADYKLSRMLSAVRVALNPTRMQINSWMATDTISKERARLLTEGGEFGKRAWLEMITGYARSGELAVQELLREFWRAT